MKKVPLRMCVITREKLEKKDLFRVVRINDSVVYDSTGKLNGKGAYLKKNIEVINKAKKNKMLDKLFEVNIDDSLYEELIKNI